MLVYLTKTDVYRIFRHIRNTNLSDNYYLLNNTYYSVIYETYLHLQMIILHICVSLYPEMGYWCIIILDALINSHTHT